MEITTQAKEAQHNRKHIRHLISSTVRTYGNWPETLNKIIESPKLINNGTQHDARGPTYTVM